MAQPQRQTDVHQDEFCPPNKRYALMDSNKKMDLDNPFTWIYSGRFWHTLKEDGSKYRLSFMLVRKELTLTLDDFRTIFQMPQATDNNHEHFIAAPNLAEQKSHDEDEAKQNVQKVEEHLIAEEIEKLVEGTENVENVEVDSSTLRQNETQNDPGTRLEPKSNKESPEVEITAEVQPVIINEEEEGSAKDDYELKRRENGRMQKTSEHGTYVFGESSSGQDNESKPGPSTSDELPTEKVSKELVNEMSQTVDEAKLRKVVNEMKEILVLPHLQKPTLVVQSCQRDPKTHALSLVNQDLLYLKKGISGPEKIVMSLHKFLAVIFLDDDIEERTSRWSDYKNLNKNDIEDMYLLIVNSKVDDNAETGLMWSLSVFIRSIEIWERVHDFQLVLEGLMSYNNDVKHGYVTSSLSKEDVEYLRLFVEEIDERLKHRDQMRR
ncbi:hypothetical protein Tco_0236014 [Tanacetum coccineum]